MSSHSDAGRLHVAHSDLAILNRPKSFDPFVETIIDPSAEPFGLLPSEIAEVKDAFFISPFQLRSARVISP